MSGEMGSTPDLPARLGDVLNAVYAAYGTGWDAIPGAATGAQDLAEEAIYLGRLLVSLMPGEAEPLGLLALMLYCEARRPARRDRSGRFVPLSQQDSTLWSRDMIIEAEGLLTSAARNGQFGRFQCEAAIQSVHVQRPVTGKTNHQALRTLYDMLAARSPSIGVLVARAASILDAGDAETAIGSLDQIGSSATAKYQPYWVTRANALASLRQHEEAMEAARIAIGLTEDEAVRAYLLGVSRHWKNAPSAV